MADNDWEDVSSDWEDVPSGDAVDNNKKQSMAPAIGAGAAGALAVGGAGYVANKNIIQPFLEMRKANNQLRAIGDIYKISPKVSSDFIPKALQDRIASNRTESEVLLGKLRDQSNFKVSQIGKEISDINSTATTSSADLANIIKSNAPNVYRTTTDNFGKALDAIDSMAEKTGFTLSNEQFTSNVLDKVIEDAQKSGIDPKAIKQLMDAKEGIIGQSKILDAKGNPVGTSMKLSDAKTVISNLTREEPYSPLSAKIRESWASFLEKESPPEVRPLYEKLNATYKPFAEARNFLTKLSDPKTGIVDSSGIARYIENYVKKGSDTGISNLMELLGNGNELVPKIDGLYNKFGTIKGLKDTKISLSKILEDTKASGAINVNAQQQKNLEEILNLQKAKNLANELVNISSTAGEKLPWNAVGRMAGKVFGLGRKLAVGIPGGVVQDELMKKSVGYAPEDALSKILGAKFGSPETKAKILKSSEEEAMKALRI